MADNTEHVLINWEYRTSPQGTTNGRAVSGTKWKSNGLAVQLDVNCGPAY